MSILSWINDLFLNIRRRSSYDWEMERFLSQAADGVDLERRMREWDRRRLNQNGWLNTAYKGEA